MKQLLRIYRFVFTCHHQMSRVFTFRKRTYQVCLKCGQEFDYSWELMHSVQTNTVNAAYAPEQQQVRFSSVA